MATSPQLIADGDYTVSNVLPADLTSVNLDGVVEKKTVLEKKKKVIIIQALN